MKTRAMNTHLSHEEIQEYIGGGLETTAQSRVAGHLRACKMCDSTYHAFVEIDQALRSSPVEQVDAAFTRKVMNKIPLVSKSPLAFRMLEKLAPLFALFVVVAILLTAFVLTGVIDVRQVSEGQNQVQEFFAGSASQIGSGVSSFSSWLGEYVPFVFGVANLGITSSIFAVVLTLALLDRIFSRKIVQRIR